MILGTYLISESSVPRSDKKPNHDSRSFHLPFHDHRTRRGLQSWNPAYIDSGSRQLSLDMEVAGVKQTDDGENITPTFI